MLSRQKQIEEQAVGWRIRVRGEADPDWAAFTAWLEADPAHAAAYDEIALAEAGADAVIAEIPDEPPVPAGHEPRPERRRYPARRAFLGGSIAASLLAFAAYSWMGGSDAYAVESRPGEKRQIALADGTRLELNGGTRLLLDRDRPRFARIARGEALFRVVHDSRRPFEVEAGGIVLRDAGTVFNVIAEEDGLEVAVSEGAVLYDPAGEAVRLEPGMALRKKRGAPAAVARVDLRAVGGWREGRLVYAGARIAQVAADLRRSLGLDVSVDSRAAARPFSGVIMLDGEPKAALADAASILGLELRQEGRKWILAPGTSATD